jgi:hypothetical protein
MLQNIDFNGDFTPASIYLTTTKYQGKKQGRVIGERCCLDQ